MYASKRPMSTQELVTVEIMECIEVRSAQRERDRMMAGTCVPEWRGGFLITPSSDRAMPMKSAPSAVTNVVFSMKEYVT
ncbi:MAG: hypothetical protein AAB343_03610 [Patescibacteria group bacterium]